MLRDPKYILSVHDFIFVFFKIINVLLLKPIIYSINYNLVWHVDGGFSIFVFFFLHLSTRLNVSLAKIKCLAHLQIRSNTRTLQYCCTSRYPTHYSLFWCRFNKCPYTIWVNRYSVLHRKAYVETTQSNIASCFKPQRAFRLW